MALATAPASRATLHRVGSWSPRDDRTPSLVVLGIMWAANLVGFLSDIPRYLHRNPPAPRIVHVHGLVSTIWLVLLAIQVLTVFRDRVAWHRRFGWFVAAWAVLLMVIGIWAGLAIQLQDLHTRRAAHQFISFLIVDVFGFAVLLAWGLVLRNNPAAHRRLMMLATISLMDPAFNRVSFFLGHSFLPRPHNVWLEFSYYFYGNVLLILLMAFWDWRLGRLMRQFVFGATALLAAEFAACLIYFWHPWQRMATSWVEALARLTS